MPPELSGTLTDVPGLRVGHHTDLLAATGCTVVLCEPGAIAAVDVRGAAPATRETDLLRPENTVQTVNAVLLSGGSAFGLSAADGVVRFLEEQGSGFPTSAGPVPIVPTAALFDLGLGTSARPGADEGFAACRDASTEPVAEGSVGAGTGATVGHLRGLRYCTRGGLGSASRRLRSGATVGVIVVVNAFGDVADPESGRILAGVRDADGRFLDSTRHLEDIADRRPTFGQNTTLAIVATDAQLDRSGALRVAQMGHDGLARAIRPAHTGFDGDAIFALSTADAPPVDPTIVGGLAAVLIAEAVVGGVVRAVGLAGIPACSEMSGR